MAARCETVLNTTMAEMETYHTQKLEDFHTLTKEHLDGEIQFYEQVSEFERQKRHVVTIDVFSVGFKPAQCCSENTRSLCF